jgi:hypothetical protein
MDSEKLFVRLVNTSTPATNIIYTGWSKSLCTPDDHNTESYN